MIPRAMMTTAVLACSLALLGSGGASAQSNNPDFRLNNRTGSTINEVYVSSSARANWGRDLLGDNTLPSGQSLNVVLPAGQCMNDIRVVYANGAAQERRQVNTCGITDFNFTR
ncbi:hypothetical protein [Roseomonas indoligenes]|uniref:Uncharacterized protein n=1 Tax=Roseomonas indoligenes TaxID=2820811 RepID=A0A940N726_9PROT|nr:hypothetical protein [Pararoseomonas indoligenes]MBP0495292.1 hypothetical protein [Pararoseomonas indoligenes]